MMLVSEILLQTPKFNDCRPKQWVDIEMMLVSVILPHLSRSNDISPEQ